MYRGTKFGTMHSSYYFLVRNESLEGILIYDGFQLLLGLKVLGLFIFGSRNLDDGNFHIDIEAKKTLDIYQKSIFH